MESEMKQVKTLELMAEHEKAISRLYQEYARKFPKQKDFWFKIASEEVDHANWIYRLYSQAKEGLLHFKEGRFKKAAIETSLKYVKSKLTEAQIKNISAKKALSVARDLENGLIEKNYFEIFKSDRLEIKQVFRDIANATREHRIRIEKAWSGAE